jgi:hypothetical protein
MVSKESPEIAKTCPLAALSFAYPDWNAVSSFVQPPVKALGKNANKTGPFSTILESVKDFPVVSVTVKSGATSPTAGVDNAVPKTKAHVKSILDFPFK